ncbi:MAG: WGR domain-containing protein [Ruminiclostridium sp.]
MLKIVRRFYIGYNLLDGNKIKGEVTGMSTRKLIELNTDKIWAATLSDKSIKIEYGKRGKTRTREKNFDSHSAAQKQFVKQEWEMLKKGYVFRNPESNIGCTILWNRYILDAYL